MSDSVQPQRQQPTRLPCPWDSPDKNTGVGCHFLLQCMKVKSEREVDRSCPTPRDPMDCSLLGSSLHGICQTRVLEWVAIAFSISVDGPEEDPEVSDLPYSGYCNGRQHTWWLIANRKLFLTVLESVSQWSCISMIKWGPFSRLQMADSLLCPHTEEGVKKLWDVFFIGALTPIVRGPPLWPKHHPIILPPDTLWVRLQLMNFWRDTCRPWQI